MPISHSYITHEALLSNQKPSLRWYSFPV